MRVTDLTKQTAILRNIQSNAERLQTLQETMASGRRINRLSDDPIGAVQAQDFRTKLSFFDMLKHIMARLSFGWTAPSRRWPMWGTCCGRPKR